MSRFFFRHQAMAMHGERLGRILPVGRFDFAMPMGGKFATPGIGEQFDQRAEFSTT